MNLITAPAEGGRDVAALPGGRETDMAALITAGNGHYWRDPRGGVWRYALWRDRRYPVRSTADPGDLRGAWRYDAFELVAWAGRHPSEAARRFAEIGCPDVAAAVPGAIDVLDERGQVVDLIAPQLALSRLADARAVAAYLGVAPSSVSTDLSRGYFPRPVVTFARGGGTGSLWAWPIVDRYRDWRPPLD